MPPFSLCFGLETRTIQMQVSGGHLPDTGLTVSAPYNVPLAHWQRVSPRGYVLCSFLKQSIIPFRRASL